MNRSRSILLACLFLFTAFIILVCIGKIRGKNKPFCGTVSYDYPSNIDTSLDYKVGKSLFMNQCAGCHAIHVKVVGPALIGIKDRGPWKDTILLFKYIRDPFSVKNNKYVDDLRKQYPVRHPPYFTLSDSTLTKIIYYINSESKRKDKALS